MIISNRAQLDYVTEDKVTAKVQRTIYSNTVTINAQPRPQRQVYSSSTMNFSFPQNTVAPNSGGANWLLLLLLYKRLTL